MITDMSKVSVAHLPYGEAPARLGYCVLNNKECSDSECFTAKVTMAQKIQNLNFFAGATVRAPVESLMIDFGSRALDREKIRNLRFSLASLLQGKNSQSEFSFVVKPSGGAKKPIFCPEYRTSVRTKMRELKM